MISEELFKRVKENLEIRHNGPYCVDLVLNNFCNLNCLYCSAGKNFRENDALPKENLIRLLDSARKMRVKEISLTSLTGEPFLFKEIRFLMQEIKGRNFFGSLLTNGSLLSPEFAQLLEKIKWDVLIISLDSFDPQVQYALRQPSADKDYLNKICEFLKYTSKINLNLNLNFNMVVTNLNYDRVDEYFSIAESYGARNITLLKLVKMNENYEKLALTREQLIEFRGRLRRINTAISFNGLEWLSGDSDAGPGQAGNENIAPKKNCYFHLYKVLVGYDGQILKCNGDPQRTPFSINDADLRDIYPKLLNDYARLKINPDCYDTCCSPIKRLNQEIGYCLESGGLRERPLTYGR